jgi:polar amino acid transport system substrate-binding protein
MFINEERAQQILFSDPDYCVSESLLVPEGNPDNLSDYQSVIDSGATIAVLAGAVEEGYVADAGVPQDQIELYDDVNQQYDDLAAGRVDAVTGTYLTVKTQADAMSGFEAVDGFFPLDENGEEIKGCGGFGFDDEELRDAFDAKLDQLQEDGTVMEIVTSFGFAEADVQAASELTVADLTG